MANKKKYVLFGATLLIFIVLCSAAYSFLFTPLGLKTLVRYYPFKFANYKNIIVERIEGNLVRGATFRGVQIKKFERIPDIGVKIQELNISLTGLNFRDMNLKVTNGRLEFPEAMPIIFQGNYQNKLLDCNIYSSFITLNRDLSVYFRNDFLKNARGVIIEPDIYVKGTCFQKNIHGKLMVKELAFNKFILTDCPVSLNGTFTSLPDNVKTTGEIVLGQGILATKRAVIKIEKGKLSFSGDIQKPSFDMEGVSLIGDTKIFLVFKGTLDKPDLQLSSDPPLPPNVLMIMLATGEPWKGAQSSLLKGQPDPDLVRDFVDYFVFGGSAAKLAKALGISDISLKYDAGSKSITATTSISNKFGLSYGVEQRQPLGKPPTTQYNVGAELKVTDNVSVEAEKQIQKQQTNQLPQDQPDNKILLKYKKTF